MDYNLFLIMISIIISLNERSNSFSIGFVILYETGIQNPSYTI